MGTRITVDTGGTFTDVVVADGSGSLSLGKALTDQQRISTSIREGLAAACEPLGRSADDVLREADVFVYATTRATNAILEGTTARTALLTTAGFPDVLVLREGGRSDAFDFTVPFPEPYIPRRLTFEITERIGAEGGVVRELDEAAAVETIRGLAERGVEAVAVCLLWSIANPAHEVRLGELLAEHLPGVPVTLSHRLNPILREYRRASATAIDASLKPLMQAHLAGLEQDLRAHGFGGELMAATSFGGVMHVGDLAERPIYSARSGPSMAPVAGRAYAGEQAARHDVIVCDTGGTSFDVSLVHNGEIVFTRETWLGGTYSGHLTGLASVDARSIGAGGGSIAWVDPGGLLRVGPRSAGSEPGPAAYGRGGTLPTVTDAATVLGYLNPDTFHAGRMRLDADAARAAVGKLGAELGLDTEACAAAIFAIANEHMVRAIQELTVNEGVDPRDGLVVAGGGAGGLNTVAIMRELGCRRVLVPRTAGGLSACGAQFSDIIQEYSATRPTSSAAFDFDGVEAVLAGLRRRAQDAVVGLQARGYTKSRMQLAVEARYQQQNWEIEVVLPSTGIASASDVDALVTAFHDEHERLFMVRDPDSPVECLVWRLRLVMETGAPAPAATPVEGPVEAAVHARRPAVFDGSVHDTAVVAGTDLRPGNTLAGPAVIEEPTTTIVLPPGATAVVTATGDYLIEVGS
ncbi:hydantoinase/oxoprolinase family protein [Pseudonocardia sp. C8]|uniref:hydantoinase/oxoprolinase family protein n=1 Tax=Pseudonocardia sp. C8 TaxID=2762759 RepID=UPI0016429780|nr:hydantoinase/oxoprolinase family protein [Pseudonocardia sp. C8]MBC3191000.1 hydantoinase/oxoprolinase family protein [Pseudonocardia sp. C8]